MHLRSPKTSPAPHTPGAAKSRRSFAASPALRAAAVAAGGALLLAGCSGGGDGGSAATVSQTKQKTPYKATPLDKPYTKPDVTLTDTDGKPYDLRKETAGKLTLVYFGYTHCPDECPTTMADIAVAKQQLPKDEQKKVNVVFITTDPKHDSPKEMRPWLDSFDKSFVGLTGKFGTIQDAARSLGVGLSPATVAKDGSITAVHGTQIVPFASDDKAHVLFTGGAGPKTIAHDLPLLLKNVPPHGSGSGGKGGGEGADGRAEKQGEKAAKGARHTPPKLAVHGAYVPKPASKSMAAGYLEVRNSGGTTDRLTRVSSPDATKVTMHTTSGGRMEPVTGFNVPAGGTLKLARGGNHLMLEDLKKPLKKGGTVTLKLTFARSGPETVKVPVESMTYRPGSHG